MFSYFHTLAIRKSLAAVRFPDLLFKMQKVADQRKYGHKNKNNHVFYSAFLLKKKYGSMFYIVLL